MKAKQVSPSSTQLTLDFEYESSISAPLNQPSKPKYRFSQADFEEWQAIEHDIMYGRGAYLYQQIERDLARQREQARILNEFEQMRASIYQ